MVEKLPNKHQLRSEESRRKVIEAFVDCVSESGVANTTTAKIAARAGVTWGVLQHQFGSKNQIFAAVVEAWADEFIDALGQIDTGGKDLEATVEELVEIFWSYFSKPVYRACLEILLNTGDEAAAFAKSTRQVATDMYGCWRESMRRAGCTSSDEAIDLAGQMMATTLSGYAIRIALRPDVDPSLEPQRAFLVSAVLGMLDGG